MKPHTSRVDSTVEWIWTFKIFISVLSLWQTEFMCERWVSWLLSGFPLLFKGFIHAHVFHHANTDMTPNYMHLVSMQWIVNFAHVTGHFHLLLGVPTSWIFKIYFLLFFPLLHFLILLCPSSSTSCWLQEKYPSAQLVTQGERGWVLLSSNNRHGRLVA